MPAPGLFSYRPFWAKRFGVAPFLPKNREEMEALGWEACDVILVTGDAYVDHPSFGMAIIGRLLEDQGFRVGIIDQPNFRDIEAFRVLGEPTLFFGVTAGNMDSMVNHYTSDKKPRSDDAYTPEAVAGARPDRATIVYTQRCREAYPACPVILGGIEASLRRIAHYDYWSDKVRRSVLVESGADLLVFGNAERAIVDIAHRVAKGHHPRQILDVRGTVVRRPTNELGPQDVEPGRYVVISAEALDEESSNRLRAAPTKEDASIDGATVTSGFTPAGDDAMVTAVTPLAKHPRELTVVRLPSWEAIRDDKVRYAHCSHLFHLESNPHHARCLVQRNGAEDVWVNPPPIPLTTAELDHVYGLPFQKLPHPAHAGKKLPAYEMIRFSITIMRGCFGGCSFCSITEHEGRIIQNRSEESILREVAQLSGLSGFTGAVSDLGGPSANMYRLGCKRPEVQAKCRKPSCVYPKICPNLNCDHGPLVQLYRKARAVPGIKKIAIASGVRYDLAVESPEYVKELVTHHVGGYLKIAPEHISEGPLSKMMKPTIKSYERFKELFLRYSAQANKEQYLILYFIAAHPGTTMKDMVELSLWLKDNGYRADQVQVFLPSPMSYATAMYYSGKNPLLPVTRAEGDVHTVKLPEERALQKAFLRYHDAKNWPLLRQALTRMGRQDLIGSGPHRLVPWDGGYAQRAGHHERPATPLARLTTPSRAHVHEQGASFDGSRNASKRAKRKG